MTRERPILFSTPMVRAILDGSKTQTRRVVKPWEPNYPTSAPKALPTDFSMLPDGTPFRAACPYGQPGDRLWVRETFQGPMWEEGTWDPDTDYHKPEFCEYRADGGPMPEYVDFEDNLHQGWKPSIHMPRWASRITLEVTGVRVERLQDISARDAIAEGVKPTSDGAFHIEEDQYRAPDPAECYARLWEAINGPGSWDANRWVWVVEFNLQTEEKTS